MNSDNTNISQAKKKFPIGWIITVMVACLLSTLLVLGYLNAPRILGWSEVPNLTGLPREDATYYLDLDGIPYEIIEQPSGDPGVFGLVFLQSPSPGRYLVPGRSVTLAVAVPGPEAANNDTNSEIAATEVATAKPDTELLPTETPGVPTETPPPAATPLGGGAGQIAFASNRTGLPQIWLVNLDGSGLTQLTDLPGGACQPAWSPDSSQVAFISPCEENAETYPEAVIWLMAPDGQNPQPLTSGPGDYDPAWSPDGSQIAYTSARDGRTQIYIMTIATGTEENFSNNTVFEYAPMWKPDSSAIAFISTSAGPTLILERTLNDREVTQFTHEEIILGQPVISPDGSVYLFNSTLRSGLLGLVAARVADGGFKSSPVFLQPSPPMRDAAYSADGWYIAYESWPDGANHDIFIATSNGQPVQQITSDAAFDFDPAWRP